MGWCARWLCVALALVWACAAPGQDVRSPILTIDSERLYQDSAFGQRVLREIEAQTSALAEENRILEEKLEAEEQELTVQRQSMSPSEFRILADAFDTRVQAIRRERDAQSRQIAAQLEDNRDQFLVAAAPVLEMIMREANAAIIIERREVFISANAIDITETAIERIDAALGDGTVTQD